MIWWPPVTKSSLPDCPASPGLSWDVQARRRGFGRYEQLNKNNDMVTFEAAYQVTWSDLDSNRHLRNTAYLDYAAQTRFLYFDSRSFGPSEFSKFDIGPAVLEETVHYRKELGFLQEFLVDMRCAGTSRDGRKFIMANRFLGVDRKPYAEIRSFGIWFDLSSRSPSTPPERLLGAMQCLEKTEDFEILD